MTTERGTKGERRVRLYEAGKPGIITTALVDWARALLAAAAVLAIGELIDQAIAGESAGPALVWLAVTLLIRGILSTFPSISSVKTAIEVERDLRGKVLEAALVVGPNSDKRTGRILTQATEGVEAVGALAGTFLPQLLTGMSIPLLLSIFVAILDWPTALVLLALLPTIPLLLRMLESRFASVTARYRETADELSARFLDGIQGLKTLKTLGFEREYGHRIADEAERLRAETMRLLRVNQLALLLVDLSLIHI